MRVGAEDDHVGVLGLGELAKTVGGRGVDDHVAIGAGGPDRAGAALEQLVGVLLVDSVPVAVLLLGVTNIGEGDVGAGAGEDPCECDGVLVVGGAVIGNDELAHDFLLPLWGAVPQ